MKKFTSIYSPNSQNCKSFISSSVEPKKDETNEIDETFDKGKTKDSTNEDTLKRLRNKRGKDYKRSPETRLKISIAMKGKKPMNGIVKGQVGKDHPSYKHGMGKNRDFDPEKRNAWIEGVKHRDNYRCLISGEKRKEYLACHHLNAWNWCIEGRYDI